MSLTFEDADADDKAAVAYLIDLAEKRDKQARSEAADVLRFAALAIRLRAERDIWHERAMSTIRYVDPNMDPIRPDKKPKWYGKA